MPSAAAKHIAHTAALSGDAAPPTRPQPAVEKPIDVPGAPQVTTGALLLPSPEPGKYTARWSLVKHRLLLSAGTNRYALAMKNIASANILPTLYFRVFRNVTMSDCLVFHWSIRVLPADSSRQDHTLPGTADSFLRAVRDAMPWALDPHRSDGGWMANAAPWESFPLPRTRLRTNMGEGVFAKHGTLRPRRHPSSSEERRVGKECRSRWSPYH